VATAAAKIPGLVRMAEGCEGEWGVSAPTDDLTRSSVLRNLPGVNPSESERIARLEREMAILRAEFARLREHVGVPAAARPEVEPPPPSRQANSAAPPPPEGDAAGPRRSSKLAPSSIISDRRPSLEDVIGRYATIGVAAVLVLIGVGAFLSWAIRNGVLGPTGRVVFGYAAAAGLAYGGLRLRARGTREYGNVLMAIALGIVHLVCWSAGPLLHVLP
jgi:uncharacterized membrane protein